MKIKICGLRYRNNIEAIARLRPDLMGFIFYPGSPRFVGEAFMPSDMDPAREAAKTVGVFVNESLEVMKETFHRFKLDFLQLHGSEDAETCARLFESGHRIIKAFHPDENSFIAIKAYQPYCEYFLFDTAGTSPGGTGKAFDWSQLEHYNLDTPFLLSGGLGAKNISAALNIKHPQLAGYDLNSQIEHAPGRKSVSMAHSIIDQIRTYALA